jgi:ribosomal-protein-alanine N-acetyltransferase
VGKVNVVDAVRGRFESAAIGYDAYDPYAGAGLFAEGLRLLLTLLFAPEESGGMGLHRVQAAVQPGNLRSGGLLRSLGFQREGFSPRMLWLPGADGGNAWRDHDSYVMMAEQWPAQPYLATRGRTVVALVNGGPGSGATVLARQLAAELWVPLFCEDVVGSGEALWDLVADSPPGGVIQGTFTAGDAPAVAQGLQRCGLDPAEVHEVCCFSPDLQQSTQPLGLGPQVSLEAAHELGRADIVRIALQVRA